MHPRTGTQAPEHQSTPRTGLGLTDRDPGNLVRHHADRPARLPPAEADLFRPAAKARPAAMVAVARAALGDVPRSGKEKGDGKEKAAS